MCVLYGHYSPRAKIQPKIIRRDSVGNLETRISVVLYGHSLVNIVLSFKFALCVRACVTEYDHSRAGLFDFGFFYFREFLRF